MLRRPLIIQTGQIAVFFTRQPIFRVSWWTHTFLCENSRRARARLREWYFSRALIGRVSHINNFFPRLVPLAYSFVRYFGKSHDRSQYRARPCVVVSFKSASRERSRGVGLRQIDRTGADISINRRVTRAGASLRSHWEKSRGREKRIMDQLLRGARYYCKLAMASYSSENKSREIHLGSRGCRNSGTWDVSWVSTEISVVCVFAVRANVAQVRACVLSEWFSRDAWFEIHIEIHSVENR